MTAIGRRKRRARARARQAARLLRAGGELEPLMDVEHDKPRNRFNDGKVDRGGRGGPAR